MKWFKHDSDAKNDIKSKLLISRFGLEGYGIFWGILEFVADDVSENKNPSEWGILPEMYSIEFFATEFKIEIEKMESVLDYMAQIDLINKEMWDKGRIANFKVLSRADEYTDKLRKKFRNSPDSVPTISRPTPEQEQNRIEQNRVDQKRKDKRIDQIRKEKSTPTLSSSEKSSEERVSVSRSSSSYSPHYEEWWKTYPKQINKKGGWKNYERCIKEGVAPEQLLAAAANYAKFCREQNTEIRFTLLPSTFLGPDKRYEDYLDAEKVKAMTKPVKDINTRHGVGKPKDFKGGIQKL